MSYSLWPCGLQHARPPCPSLSPGVCSSSCPLSQWCYLTVSSSAALFSFCLQYFPAWGSFPMSWALCIRWPKYWSFSFSISPSNDYSGLISLKIKWLHLLVVQGTLERESLSLSFFSRSVQNSNTDFLYFTQLTMITITETRVYVFKECHRDVEANILCFIVGDRLHNWLGKGTSLFVQWLRLHTCPAGAMGLIPGRGTKIPYAVCHSKPKQKTKT